MHFLTVVLLHQEVPLEETALQEAIYRLLEPYFLELQAPTHKEYYSARAIQNLATRYCVRAANLPKIAAKLRKDVGVECGVDERGLYYISDLNPDGKYDYWTLHSIEKHVWLVRDMPRDLLPSAVVTPDGHWHETGEEKWDWQLTERERQDIWQRAYALLDQYPNYRAVALDCHA